MEHTFSIPIIYVFRINDAKHKGCLKIGKATLPSLETPKPNSDILIDTAKKRIQQYTKTAAIDYELLWTECTVFQDGKTKTFKYFDDKQVHTILMNSGIKKQEFEDGGNEWFVTNLDTVKNAIKAAKEGRKSLASNELTKGGDPIVFRPEQKEAIEKTIKHFKKSNQMLWNAKMRFGKTLCTLEVVRQMKFRKTIIVTHRPVVDAGWFEDFTKIFGNEEKCYYGSKGLNANGKQCHTFDYLDKLQKMQPETKYIYFASMQDLRGSECVGGNHPKNVDVFSNDWDCFIIDEAHEGTKTEIGKRVIDELTKKNTKVLNLSGTPFNLFDDFTDDDVYTWDYTMEQKAKKDWDEKNYGSANPYAELPKMHILAYNLGELFKKFADDEISFNFHEFFRVNPKNGKFIYEDDVKRFLNLLCDKKSGSGYPFSTDEYRELFRHTLWTLPGVASAKALSALMYDHPVFGNGSFKIVNVAGEGDDDEENDEALKMVKEAIGEDKKEYLNDPEKSPLRPDHYTITLTCGRLTTGVSVKSWTAVFLLSGSSTTSAASYMQTIFRVQTPATICGRVKTDCYVFEFAPDRTLKLIAEAVNASPKARRDTTDRDRNAIEEFINFCPVISMKGSKMEPYDVNTLLGALKRAQIERVVTSGFEDSRLYKYNELRDLPDEVFEKVFQPFKAALATGKSATLTEVDITDNGVDGKGKGKDKKGKGNKTTTSKKKIPQDEIEKRQRRKECIAILRGMSVRMPLMIYGAELKDEVTGVTVKNFPDIVDDESWLEFMPKGVTKDDFKVLSKYYDQDVFVQAGKRIREMVRSADSKSVNERIDLIAQVFSYFRNPDKETVLTPWRVVNMHMGECVGGYNFYNEDYKKIIEEPRYVEKGNVTDEVFNANTKLLEINSKTGLYPLYITYSTYRKHLDNILKYSDIVDIKKEDERKLWDKTLKDNIFIICKTPMAESITRRTLGGFRNPVINAKYIDNLVDKAKSSDSHLIMSIKNGANFWGTNKDIFMKLSYPEKS